MADIEKGSKKSKRGSKKSGAEFEGAETSKTTATSWRDFITDASAALNDLDQAAPTDKIEWTSETQNLEMNEDPAAHFEELAKRVAHSVEARAAERIGDPEPSAMGDDSGESKEILEPQELGDEPETSFDLEAGEPLEAQGVEVAEGDLVAVEGVSGDEEAGSEDAPNSEVNTDPRTDFGAESMAFDFEMTSDLNLTEPAEFISNETLTSVIESLLFSTDKPVSTTTIKQIFKDSNIRSKDIQRALESLSVEYASSHRGVTLEEVGGGYQLRTKSDNADYLRRLAKVRPFRLSGPALEVMAIVAYKQPITKHEIDEIRGVESGHLLRALMERGLVSFGGKSELPGKPMTYCSTRKFLETFGLRNLKELPTLSEIEELLPEGIGEVEEKETLANITDSLSTSIGSTYSEAEDELTKINEQLQQVDTTSEFFEQEKIRERERRDRERAQDIRERLVVGEAVDEKDRRWLDRYDAKLLAGPVISGIQDLPTDETVVMSEAPEANTPLEAALSEQLETLSEEAVWVNESDLESDEDLVGNEDWDEDDDHKSSH